MVEKLHFTKDEFNQIRKAIINAFESNGLTKYYTIKKSTYQWSSKNDFLIVIDCYSNWKELADIGPYKKIQIVKNLFDTAVKFIEDESHNFTFVEFIGNKTEFNFSFVFQPTLLRAKTLLEYKNG